MDEYTKKTKEWLDKKFKSTDEKGVYKSHAPIYGFANDSLSLGLYKNNYTILKEIEKLSSEYKIDTFLDAGCAEGFTAHLVKNIFGFKVSVTDLSSEAIKRAREVYGIYGFEGDIQSLDNIADSSFDLVLCSETIEHVPFYEKAFLELMRITKKVLIITVPAAKNMDEKKNYIAPQGPHTHLNIFTRKELEEFTDGGRVRGISLVLIDKLESIFMKKNPIDSSKKPKYLVVIYKIIRFLVFPIRIFYGISMAKIFIKIDYLLCSIFPNFSVNTYMVVFKKVPPDLKNYPQKSKNILDYMFLKSKVKPYFLHEHKEKV